MSSLKKSCTLNNDFPIIWSLPPAPGSPTSAWISFRTPDSPGRQLFNRKHF